MRAPTGPVRLASLVLALAAGALACGADDGGERAGADPAVAPAPAAAPTTPAELCTAVLNERDAGVARAGREAALDVVLRWREGTPPSGAEAEAGITAIEAWRDVLLADRERLAGAEVDGADAEHWDVVVGSVDQEVALLDERIAVLAADDWEEAVAGLQVGGPAPSAEEEAAAQAALDALGLVGRDCEVVAASTGTPAEARGFVARAATTCSAIVSRRREGGHDADRDRVLEVLVAIHDEEEVVVDDGLAGAVDRVREEWVATHADLAALAAGDAPDPEGWAQVVGVAEDRAAVFARRAEAVATGDQGEIVAAFDPDLLGDPGFEGFAPNHLGDRDCRSIEP